MLLYSVSIDYLIIILFHWKFTLNKALYRNLSPGGEEPLMLELNEALAEAGIVEDKGGGAVEAMEDMDMNGLNLNTIRTKRIGFLFDSTLTAFLMMGNLSPVSIIRCIV